MANRPPGLLRVRRSFDKVEDPVSARSEPV